MYIHHILLTILSCLFKCTELQSWRFYEEFLVHLLSCCPNKKIFNTVHMDIQEVRQSCFKFCKACCTPPTYILTSTLVFHFTNKHWMIQKLNETDPVSKYLLEILVTLKFGNLRDSWLISNCITCNRKLCCNRKQHTKSWCCETKRFWWLTVAGQSAQTRSILLAIFWLFHFFFFNCNQNPI